MALWPLRLCDLHLILPNKRSTLAAYNASYVVERKLVREYICLESTALQHVNDNGYEGRLVMPASRSFIPLTSCRFIYVTPSPVESF